MNTSLTTSSETVQGSSRAWKLIKRLGEGDAGEVFLVESLLENETAILKRPVRSAFASDMIRQAAQITREGDVLSALSPYALKNLSVRLPRLVDRSKAETSTPEGIFIVISPAPGFDLNQMGQIVRMGADAAELSQFQGDAANLFFQNNLATMGQIPYLILLRAISSLIATLESIHTTQCSLPSGNYAGIIWNDIKPEHIYWDPSKAMFTLIDWGNAQFLESDGATSDRRNSRMDDYAQLLDVFGNYLTDLAPDLLASLKWPENLTKTDVYSAGILPLKKRIHPLLEDQHTALQTARKVEQDLLTSSDHGFTQYQTLNHVQNEILNFGENPDYESASHYFSQVAKSLISKGDTKLLKSLCKDASHNPWIDQKKCKLLANIVDIDLDQRSAQSILSNSLEDNWGEAYWEIKSASRTDPPPDWVDELGRQMRQAKFNVPIEEPTPFVALNRLIHALQAVSRAASEQKPSTKQEDRKARDTELEDLIEILKNQTLARWKQLEPDPPNSGLDYAEIDQYLSVTEKYIPSASQALTRALTQPRAQVEIILDAWDRQDFDTAKRGLRGVLLWDPDRRRIFKAYNAIQAAPEWLAALRQGPRKDEPLLDFVTRLELVGRNLRNQVGAAAWLDTAIKVLKKLRNGSEPTTVMLEYPEIQQDISWLLQMESGLSILTESLKPVLLDRQSDSNEKWNLLHGSHTAAVGVGEAIVLKDALDTWTPEARGSSARVFLSTLSYPSGVKQQAAFKIMRSDRLDYALPLFREEIQVLTQLRSVPGVVPLLECGVVRFDGEQSLPPEEQALPADHLQGEAIRFGPDSIHNFLTDLSNKIDQGWVPYIAVPNQARDNNLLLICDIGHTRGRFLPILEALRMGIQICDILEIAHARNIVYRDHKILHYYWNETENGITMIDWNIARRHPEGLAKTDLQFDLVQFGARALHHILTGRSAPGALPLGPNRPEEIEAAAHSYDVRWSYDDHRLTKDIKEILEQLLKGNYDNSRKLRDDLHDEFTKLSQLVRVD